MGWQLKRREVKSIFPLNGCLCFDNRMGTFLGSVTVTFSALFAFILILLDFAEWGNRDFLISGGFPADWRQTFWKGFVLCDIAMFIAHITMIVVSVIVSLSILRPDKYKIYDLHPQVRTWCVVMVMYLICELGVSVYIYSWYGIAAWRRPYLIFTVMFFIVRFVSNISFLVVAYSYKCEIYQELKNPPQQVNGSEFDYMSGVSGSRKAPSQIMSGSYLSPHESNPMV